MTATTEESTFFDPNVRTPEMEMAETGGGVPAAADLDIADINPLNPHLFKEDRWQDHFARLRAEDPVHFNEIETAGRYWSVTKYDDVRAVDGDWTTYSSAKGITLGTAEIAAGEVELSTSLTPFIAMDPPTHTAQRKTVRSVSAPSRIRNIEPMIANALLSCSTPSPRPRPSTESTPCRSSSPRSCSPPCSTSR